MKPTLAIFKREFAGYFRTPVACVFLVVFLVASVGLPFFLGGLFERGNASLDAYFDFQPWLFLLLVPAAGMRMWAEENRSGTVELLFTLPVTPVQAVMGKFLAGWLFIVLALALTFPLPLIIAFLGDPDWGTVATGYFGSALMAGSYLAICSLTSSLTRNQVISFVLSVSACLVLVLLGWDVFNGLLESVSVPLAAALAGFSFVTHFDSMMYGLVDPGSVVFFLSLTLFCLFANVLAIEG